MDKPLSLVFDRLGSGPPLIVLHGLLGAKENWRTPIKTLAQSMTVYSVDLRNHGRSPHQAGMDYPSMANDVLALMAREGIESAHVLGHSMGGKVAMQMAMMAPQRLLSLVVVDIAPKLYHPSHHTILTAMAELDFGSLSTRKGIDAALALNIPHVMVRQFVMTNLIKADDQGPQFQWRIQLDYIIAGYEAICAAPECSSNSSNNTIVYTGPTLFIKGGASDYIRESDHAHITALFPSADVHCIERGDHWLHATQPQAFLETLQKFYRVLL